MKIDQVRKVVSDYIKKSLSDNFKIIKIKGAGKTWIALAEVYEDSAFIKSIGLNTNAKDRNFYRFELDDKMEIIGFEQYDGDVNQEE